MNMQTGWSNPNSLPSTRTSQSTTRQIGNWEVSRVDLTPAGDRRILFEPIVPQWKKPTSNAAMQLAIAERYGRPLPKLP